MPGGFFIASLHLFLAFKQFNYGSKQGRVG